MSKIEDIEVSKRKLAVSLALLALNELQAEGVVKLHGFEIDTVQLEENIANWRSWGIPEPTLEEMASATQYVTSGQIARDMVKAIAANN